ncbi:MAG: tetraacyldisaccharide 4'-kinase [Janthinobacterium lividum]
MMPPAFWTHDGWAARALSPLSALVAGLTARRVARPGWRAPVPVLCCGNAGVGGAGKTTLVLDLVARLQARGVAVHCLSRGYGGTARGPLLVDPACATAGLVGDEPLLLAGVAPTWVGRDRAASARQAVEAGAAALVMDDGLQNPGLVQDAALLVIDGAVGFGNGRVLPAGPLREPVARAALRCRAAVLIGEDRRHARAHLPAGLPVLRARLVADRDLGGRRVLAFAGIARPGKFFATLRQSGAEILETISFPDHHPFSQADLARVLAAAATLGVRPITTPKDMVRIPAAMRHQVDVLGVRLDWESPAEIEALLAEWLDSNGSRAG